MGATNPGLPGRFEKQIWGSPSLSTLGPGLAGPAQKEKDTSASNNEQFIFLEGWGGEEQRAPSHLTPTAGITHTHMQSGMGTDPQSWAPAHRAWKRSTLKPQKITGPRGSLG